MYKAIKYFFLTAFSFFLLFSFSIYGMDQKESNTSKNKDNIEIDSKVETLLLPHEDSHIKVDYITLKNGTQEAIGYALGKIGDSFFHSLLVPFAEQSYGKEKEAFFSRDPVYTARLKGMRKALDISPSDFSRDLTFPIYDYRLPECSAILIPPTMTENGHTLIARNVDWLETKADPITNINKWAYVLEIYPNNGINTLVLGSTSLIGAPYDAMNEYGIYIAGLADKDTYSEALDVLAGGKTTRFNHLQIIRSLIDNCKTLEEVKEKFKRESPLNMAGSGMHYLIADAQGNALVAEYEKSTKKLIFSEYFNTILPFTNSSLWLEPEKRIRALSPKDSYDDFYRYNYLQNFKKSHEENKNKITKEMLWNLMEEVAANSDVPVKEGVNKGNIFRLYWTVITDLTDNTMEVRYNLKDDEPYDGEFRRKKLILSEIFKFQLQKN